MRGTKGILVALAMGSLLAVGAGAPRAANETASTDGEKGTASSSTSDNPTHEPSPNATPRPDVIVFSDGALTAYADTGVAWSLSLMLPEEAESDALPSHGPLIFKDRAYFCLSDSLYEIALAAGKVERRHHLPGACQSLELDSSGQALALQVGERASDGEGWETTYTLEPGCTIPFFLFSGVQNTLRSRRLARVGSELTGIWPSTEDSASHTGNSATTTPEKAPDASSKKGSDAENPLPAQATPGKSEGLGDIERLELETRLRRIDERLEQDRTNPWYSFYKGEYLHALGREGEAISAYTSVLGYDPAYDFELLAMIERLDEVNPEIGEKAFHRGMTFLLEHGHEPELTIGLLAPILTLSMNHTHRKADPVKDKARLERLAARLDDFAPHVEASAHFYQGMLDAHPDAPDADVWRERRDRAGPYQLIGPLGPAARYAGFWINFIIASAIALLLCFLGKTIRSFPGPFKRQNFRLAALNPLSYWTRGEQLSLILLAAAGLVGGMLAARGVATIGAAAKSPIAFYFGNLGHPSALSFSEGMTSTEGGRFIRALALQQAGRLDEAETLYETLPNLPRAKVNLGIIKNGKGRTERAEALWREAADSDDPPPEAAFNLRLDTSGPRVDRAKRYGLKQLLAMPTLEQWDQAWMAQLDEGGSEALENPFSATLSIFRMADALEGSGMPGILAIGIALLLLLALAAMIRPGATGKVTEPKFSRLGKGLDLLIPGVSRRYAIFSATLTAVFIFLAIGWLQLYLSEGISANILDAIALPSFGKYFGVGAIYKDPISAFLEQACTYVWLLWILHLVFVWLAERKAEDG